MPMNPSDVERVGAEPTEIARTPLELGTRPDAHVTHIEVSTADVDPVNVSHQYKIVQGLGEEGEGF